MQDLSRARAGLNPPGPPTTEPPPAGGPQSPGLDAPPAGAPVQTATGPPPPAPGWQQASGPSGPRAGWWRRFGAALLDGILLGVVGAVIGAIVGANAGNALGILIGLAYFTYFEGGPSGQTVGKRALGIRVIDLERGGSIGFVRGFIRWIGRYLSAIALFLGYFWMLWDKEKQTWHDKLSGAVIVPHDAYPVQNWPNG